MLKNADSKAGEMSIWSKCHKTPRIKTHASGHWCTWFQAVCCTCHTTWARRKNSSCLLTQVLMTGGNYGLRKHSDCLRLKNSQSHHWVWVSGCNLGITDLFQRLGIPNLKTFPYCPHRNLAEHVNNTLIQIIVFIVGRFHRCCDKHIQKFAYALRTAVHYSTAKTPTDLFLGRKIVTPFERMSFS